eukprot:c14027_g1_i2.p1 GENE.c14027_g1_i2~~c14027_g1_i2.p1  ORF type:complete len:142 (+),score=26.95 c14027_g1_i2:127-552(+)
MTCILVVSVLFCSVSCLSQLSDLPLKRRSLSHHASEISRIMPFVEACPVKDRELAYQAWMGFNNSQLRRLGWSKERLVQEGTEWARTVCGFDEPPALSARTVGMMGLKGVKGLRIEGQNGVPTTERSMRSGRGGGSSNGRK